MLNTGLIVYCYVIVFQGVHPFGPGDVSVSSQDVRVRLARGETLTPSRRQVYGQRGRGPRVSTP